MEYLCQYGNCHETGNLPVVLTNKKAGIAKRFCGYPHLIAWAMAEIEKNDRNAGAARLSAQLAMEGIVRLQPAAQGSAGQG